MNPKSQSQRMRSILYRLWEQDNENMEFEDYYHFKTEKIIDWLLKKLNNAPIPADEK